MPTIQLERGIRTLAHDWRNVLNGINLRILSATTAEEPGEGHAELAEAKSLVASATKILTSLTRKIVKPTLDPIPYPTSYLLEDVGAAIRQRFGADSLQWKSHLQNGKALVDYDAFLNAICELLSNSLRYLRKGEVIILQTEEKEGFLNISWSEKTLAAMSPENWGATPFFTTEKDRLGLGTYFARRVLEAHAGRLLFAFSASEKTLQTTLQIPLISE